MKTFEEYMAHAELLIINHYVEGIGIIELAEIIEREDKKQMKETNQENQTVWSAKK